MQNNNNDIGHENVFSALIDLIPDSVAIIDEKGRFVAANKALGKITGYARENLLGKNFLELDAFAFSRKEKQNLIENVRKRLKGSEIASYEIKLRAKDGSTRFIEVTGNKVSFNGSIVDLVIFHDVTERTKGQAKLKNDLLEIQEKANDSEIRYKMLLDLAPESIVTLNTKGIITSINRFGLEQAGYSENELVGKSFSKLSPLRRSDLPRYLKMFLAIKRGKAPKPFDVIYKTKSGAERTFETHVNLIKEKGKVTGIIAVSRDRTEEKRFEKELHENEEKFHGIANSVRDAVILVDEEQKVTFWNPAAEKIFGYAREEAYGKTIHELIISTAKYPEVNHAIAKGFKKFAKTGGGPFMEGNVELTAKRKDHSEFPIELSLSPIKLGDKWHAVGVAKDITERKQSEKLAKNTPRNLKRRL